MTSPFFTIEEAADYLRFPSAKSCRRWLKSQQVPVEKLGPRLTRVLRVSLDEAIARQRKGSR